MDRAIVPDYDPRFFLGTPPGTRTRAHGLGRGQWPSKRSVESRKSVTSALSTLFRHYYG